MVSWRDLGEVPDSGDEDDFDFSDDERLNFAATNQGAADSTTTTTVAPAGNTRRQTPRKSALERQESQQVERRSIWDVPGSSPQLTSPQHEHDTITPASPRNRTSSCPESSPLSSMSSNFDLPPILNSTNSSSNAAPIPEARNAFNSSGSSKLHSIDLATTAEDLDELQHSSPPTKKQKRSDVLMPSLTAQQESDDHRGIQQVAIRYERSLRPRKPIQEHPYLLENAQYASVLRQRGIKPLRMALEDERRRRQQRESTVPDDDFQDDSQESAPINETANSQLRDLDDILEELGDLEAPSSSVPKTSPAHRIADPSSQGSLDAVTDDTSVNGQDGDHGLPDLKDLLSETSRFRKKAMTVSGRRRPATDTPRRTPQDDDLVLEPAAAFRIPAPLAARQTGDGATALEHVSGPPDVQRSPTTDIPIGSFPVLEDGNNPPAAKEQPVPIHIDDESTASGSATDQSEAGSSDSDSASEKEEQVVNRTFGRRIRGVLPASWLRLDQKTNLVNIQKQVRQREKTPEREPRRGVAQKRQDVSSYSIPADLNWDSDDDTPSGTIAPPTTDDAFPNQTRLLLRPSASPDSGFHIISDNDDAGSVVEDNSIDRMVTGGRKRQVKLQDSFGRAPKRPKLSHNRRAQASSKWSQPKIDGALRSSGGSKSTAPRLPRHGPRKSRQGRSQKRPRKPQQRQKPPDLSILDVLEPEPPRFLKIAARTARAKANLGRSSPSSKLINMATRTDQTDVMTVLNHWRSGSIPQRHDVSKLRAARTRQSRLASKSRTPLSDRTANSKLDTGTLRKASHARRLQKVISDGGSVRFATGASKRVQRSHIHDKSPLQERRASFRPALLESAGDEENQGIQFETRKHVLDREYRHSNKSTTLFRETEQPKGGSWPRAVDPRPKLPPPSADSSRIQQPRRRQLRKQTRPRRIDLDSLEYSHVDDSLPEPVDVVADDELDETVTTEVVRGSGKLQGLGPYGTQYTQNFDVISLKAGVSFDTRTLIGSGFLGQVKRQTLSTYFADGRPITTLTFGSQTLRWGKWTDQVSSEFGVVFDSIADNLEQHLRGEGHRDVLETTSTIFRYVKDSLVLGNADDEIKSCFGRILGVLSSFTVRLDQMTQHVPSERQAAVETVTILFDYVLSTLYVLWQLCSSGTSMFAEQMEVESQLTHVAQMMMRNLLHLGTGQLRKHYHDLTNANDKSLVTTTGWNLSHSWLLLIKILEAMRIPRSSFWDLLGSALFNKDMTTVYEAQYMESVWRNFFSMLPLTEFDTSGVLVAGGRHEEVTDGWNVPMVLVKRTLQIYRENERQAPSFNSYCRALLARCHCLVSEWGWTKCVSVIGVIFDFFGSQRLSHLRNEEVHDSPRFLEQLSGQPVLAPEPQDKTFHLFLKLLATSLTKLGMGGSDKDVRNLVARTMPNHDRQLLKEQDIHERDLAALRNHHDLLVTLYWAALPECRPNPALIEQLVNPASAHKEACLINLRAWSQLARFVVASGEGSIIFEPFKDWRVRLFKSVWQQYDAVESEVQHQFMSLAKEERAGISRDLREAMVKMNKKSIGDVLHLSVTSSLDVMRCAPNLDAATYCFDAEQLKYVFRHFSVRPPQLEWSLLRAALRILAHYTTMIQQFKEHEDSQQSESWLMTSLLLANEGLMQLNNDVAPTFFSMSRTILSAPTDESNSSLAASDKLDCQRLSITISATLGAMLAENGLVRLSDFFKPGKYGLFEGLPSSMPLHQRDLFVLFVACLLDAGFNNFTEEGLSLEEIWLLTLVTPKLSAAGHENELARRLAEAGKPYVPEAATSLCAAPAYKSSRDMFEFAVSTLRSQVRDAIPSSQREARVEGGRVLQVVMNQIKQDLAAVSGNPSEHGEYVLFVQDLISIIRSQAADLCKVDFYFYQISQYYSPPPQDPKLQVAAMHAYGLRLEDGDQGAGRQLFYFLLNTFKVSVMADKLQEEAIMLRKGMANPGILQFIMGKMLPCIISSGRSDGLVDRVLPLLCTYAQALRAHFHSLLVTPAAEYEPSCWTSIMRAAFVQAGAPSDEIDLVDDDRIEFYAAVVGILNLSWPTVYTAALEGKHQETVHLMVRAMRLALPKVAKLCSLCGTGEDTDHEADRNDRGLVEDDATLGRTSGPRQALAALSSLQWSQRYILATNCDEASVDPGLFTPKSGEEALRRDLAKDISANWTRSNGRINIQTPAHRQHNVGKSTDYPRTGTSWPRMSPEEIASAKSRLQARCITWIEWYRKCFGKEGECFRQRQWRREDASLLIV